MRIPPRLTAIVWPRRWWGRTWACYPLVLVALAACNGAPPTPSPTPSATATPSPTAAPTPTPTMVPPPSGTLRVAVVGGAPHLDLHQMVSEWATLFGPGLAYNRLLRFSAGPEVAQPSMAVECDLCESWRVVDPLTYEFSLDPRARWQEVAPVPDRQVTAGDVVFSLERLRTPGWPHASLLDAVGTITAVDDVTVRMELRYPDADLPQKLANPHAVVLPPEVAQAADFRGGPVIGSGPWLWRQTLSGQVDLSANPGYFRPGVPAVERLLVTPVLDDLGAYAALLVGRADVAQVTEEQWKSLASEGFQSAVVQRQGMGLVLALNTQAPPFDSVEVRRALLLALDPRTALEEVWEGLGSVGVGVPVVSADWLLSDAELAAYVAQPEAAAALLESAARTPVSITLTVANFGPRYVAYGELVAQQLAAAGFDVSTETLTRSQYLPQVWRERRFQVFVGPLPPVTTTSSFLLALLHSQGQWNITGHEDSVLDGLIEEQSVELGEGRRGELVRQVQERMLEMGLLFMPVITAERWAYSPRVTGFSPSFAGGDGSFWRSVGLTDE